MDIYGVNWERTKKRHADFWNGKLEGACLHSITSPKDGATQDSYSFPTDLESKIKWWTDAEFIIKRYRSRFENTYHAGDAFPILTHDLGPAGHAGYFKNAVPKFENSIWFEPTLRDYADLEFDPNSFLYKKTIELAKAYAEDSNGDYIVGMPDVVGTADALSHLRGPEQFMMDFFDHPDELHGALKTVQAVWEKTMMAARDAVIKNNYGGCGVGWLNTWAPGFHGQLQCDCSVMLSVDMFEEFLMYELEAQANFYDYALYHFDGEAQIRHMSHLLSVKGINAIQWTNVAGQGPPTAYIPQLQQIQKAGKGVIVPCKPYEVKELLGNLSASRLHLLVSTETQAEADDLVKLIEKESQN